MASASLKEKLQKLVEEEPQPLNPKPAQENPNPDRSQTEPDPLEKEFLEMVLKMRRNNCHFCFCEFSQRRPKVDAEPLVRFFGIKEDLLVSMCSLCFLENVVGVL
jgi:hypothetical protein